MAEAMGVFTELGGYPGDPDCGAHSALRIAGSRTGAAGAGRGDGAFHPGGARSRRLDQLATTRLPRVG